MSRIRWTVAVAILAILTVALAGAGATVAGTATGAVAADSPEDALFQTDIDADNIEMAATIGPDGDADWQVTYRLELDNNESVQAFEDLESEIDEQPGTYLDPFEDRMRRTAGSAANATGRETSVGNFSIRTERTTQPDTEFGEVIFEFDWNNFASVDDGTVRAGDAVDALFLDEGTSLTFRWGSSVTLDSQTPQADTVTDKRLTWRGQRDFESGAPRAVLTTGDGASGAGGGGGLPMMPLVVAVLAIAAVGAAVVVYLRRGEEPPATDDTPTETATEEAETQEPPSELLSNEERVLTLVEDNGGRIKQKEVAETLDWSAAMTSQVVGDLRDEGQVETFRIGRENVLTLPEVDIVPDDDEAAEEDDDGPEPQQG
jgi:hypothetical protein